MPEQNRPGSFDEHLRAADDLAAAAIRENPETGTPRSPETAPSHRRYTGPVVAAVCFVLFVVQIPALQSSFKAPPSIRIGATDTDEDTDACIDTLWKISSMLQYGSLRDTSMLEPLTQRPYLVRHTDHDTIVECPNPAAHNLHSLQVSTVHRAPEAKK